MIYTNGKMPPQLYVPSIDAMQDKTKYRSDSIAPIVIAYLDKQTDPVQIDQICADLNQPVERVRNCLQRLRMNDVIEARIPESPHRYRALEYWLARKISVHAATQYAGVSFIFKPWTQHGNP